MLIAGLLAGAADAQQQIAEQLVAGKLQADLTYRQLMETLGEATSMMQTGVIRQNKQMVRAGADIVLHHPAPNHKPWTIMESGDQDGSSKAC